MAVFGNQSEGRHAALTIRLVSESEESRAAVRTIIGGIDDPPLQIFEGVPESPTGSNGDRPSSAPSDVVMVVFNGNEEASLAYLQTQAESAPRPMVFAILGERSPGLMRRVLRAGADELLFMPLVQDDVVRAFLKISETRRRAERHQGGIVISLTSLIGGVGVTSLAANLALAMHKRMNKRVALVDLALQSGGMSVFLGLDADRTILPLARLEKKLDSIQLESALTKHDSGVYLLAAPKRIEDAEIVSDVVIGSVLDLMRNLFDFVFVDCGTHVDENSVAAWERSSDVLYVVDQSIGATRCAWRFIDLFGKLGIKNAELRFILNRHDLRHPITEKQIAHTLARPVYARIPRDDKSLERVQLSGDDLWKFAAHGTLARAVDDLAHRLAGPEIEPQQTSGIFARLFSAVSARG
ncbi:MAG: AAA family ATPase [Candidatus Binataceae bacterium]|nr:AAA family ATPase [Candidatus Binataceae bacterium]